MIYFEKGNWWRIHLSFLEESLAVWKKWTNFITWIKKGRKKRPFHHATNRVVRHEVGYDFCRPNVKFRKIFINLTITEHEKPCQIPRGCIRKKAQPVFAMRCYVTKTQHMLQSVCLGYQFFSKTARPILLIFGTKLDINKTKKITKPDFRKKNWIIQKFRKICIFEVFFGFFSKTSR